MEEREQVKNDIRNWLWANRAALPLTVDHWTIDVAEMTEVIAPAGTQPQPVNALQQLHIFYKPYTKICNLR